MTKVGLVLLTKLGQIAAEMCRFSTYKLALRLNEAGHDFADHFEDTIYRSGSGLGTKLGGKLQQNCMK